MFPYFIVIKVSNISIDVFSKCLDAYLKDTESFISICYFNIFDCNFKLTMFM